MRRRKFLKFVAGAAVCPTCLASAAALASESSGKSQKPKGHGGAPSWKYEGAEGPENWGELSPAFKVCSIGVQQSPIDLTQAIRAEVKPIRVNYVPTALNVVNNGHTIQVNCDPGSSIILDGTKFKLLQYHFHHPSEHLMNGKTFQLEVHFVHISDDGTLAVLAVFVDPGPQSSALAPIWKVMPRQEGKARGGKVDPAALLPTDRSYFRYLGSLTTPPCSQKVIWSVFRTPLQMSRSQVKDFASIFPANARPVQPLHRRLLLGTNR